MMAVRISSRGNWPVTRVAQVSSASRIIDGPTRAATPDPVREPVQTVSPTVPTAEEPGPAIEGFAQFRFSAEEWSHVVYRVGSSGAPPVLLLQELPGLAPGLLDLARRLADAGFQVFLPWLFGPVGRRAPLANLARLCISREFGYLRSGRTAPLTLWLRALVSHISARNDGSAVAAIGMCVTGGFAIPLLLHPKVKAAVAAQPAIPLSLSYIAAGVGGRRARSALAVDATDMAAARERLGRGARLLAVRCVADRFCPPERLQRLREEFPAGLTVKEYAEPDTMNSAGERPHALYTKEYRLAPEEDPLHYARVAFEDLLVFLRGPAAN
jgi:dienelactone hydrolase